MEPLALGKAVLCCKGITTIGAHGAAMIKQLYDAQELKSQPMVIIKHCKLEVIGWSPWLWLNNLKLHRNKIIEAHGPGKTTLCCARITIIEGPDHGKTILLHMNRSD